MRATLIVDKKDFIETMNRVKEESKRSADDMLAYVMTLMLKSAHNATPLGRKNRSLMKRDTESETEADSDLMSIKPGVRFFRIYKQGAAPVNIFVPSIPRKKMFNDAERAAAMSARDAIVRKFKQIKFRGVAKASWEWAIARVQSRGSLGNQARLLTGQVRRNPIEIEKLMGLNFFSLEVINKLEWIRKLDPDIESRMASSAYNQMQWLERRWASGIARAQKGGAQ